MSETVLLGNGLLVAGFSDAGSVSPGVIPNGAVAWKGERIVAVGPEAEVRSFHPEARFLDAKGGLVLPGLINLHHHFYSALARGLDPGVPMKNFAEVLDRLWWRLDRALDTDTVRLSAQLSLADCIRWGCTTVFDHHASPSCLDGSLDVIAEEVEAAGLSAVLCYEVTDRNGHAEARAGVEENLRFVNQQQQGHDRIRGVLGLHASFTLRDDTLSEVSKRRPEKAGCHVHVAEDRVDIDASRKAFGAGPVGRLDRFNLLDPLSLLAHGIHLEDKDYSCIAGHDAVVVHNPESNANNGVGHLDVPRAVGHGCLVGLGTDGMSSAMLRALRAAFLAHRGRTGDPASGFQDLPELLANNVRVARRFFDEPLLGELSPNAPADVIVVDAPAPTSLQAENLFAHLVYGVSEAPVRHTIARGRVLLENFQHRTLDPGELAERARRLSPGLWQRFHGLEWGTPYLGS